MSIPRASAISNASSANAERSASLSTTWRCIDRSRLWPNPESCPKELSCISTVCYPICNVRTWWYLWHHVECFSSTSATKAQPKPSRGAFGPTFSAKCGFAASFRGDGGGNRCKREGAVPAPCGRRGYCCQLLWRLCREALQGRTIVTAAELSWPAKATLQPSSGPSATKEQPKRRHRSEGPTPRDLPNICTLERCSPGR